MSINLDNLSYTELTELSKVANKLAEKKLLEPVTKAIESTGLSNTEFGHKYLELLTGEQSRALAITALANSTSLADAQALLDISEEDYLAYKKGKALTSAKGSKKPRKKRDTSNIVKKEDLTQEEIALIKAAPTFGAVKNLPAGTKNAGRQLVIGIYNSIKGIKVQRKRSA